MAPPATTRLLFVHEQNIIPLSPYTSLDIHSFSSNPLTPHHLPGFALDPTTHPHLTPSNLAAAGFFHDPSGSTAGSSDTCRCFLCGVRLGGWDEQDDPFEEHAKRGGCAWADMVCKIKVERRRAEKEGREWRYAVILYCHLHGRVARLMSNSQSCVPKCGVSPLIR